MADVPDLPDVMATDALLDQLAAGQQLEVDDPAAAPLATLTTLVQQPPLPEPSPALRAAAAAGRTLGALADRRFALRSLAAAAAVVGVVCTGGFSAAVTGDPLYPVRSIIEQVSPGERGKIPAYLVDSDDEESTAEGAQPAPADTEAEPRLYPTDDPTTSVASPGSASQPDADREADVEGAGGQAAGAPSDSDPAGTSASGSAPAETGDSAETTSESVAGSDGTDSDAASTDESESDTAGSDETGSDGTGSDGTGSDTSDGTGSDTSGDSGSDTGTDSGSDTTATTGDPGTGSGGSDGTESGDSGAGTTGSDGAGTGSETDGSPTPGSAPGRDPLNEEVEGDLGAGADSGPPPCDDTTTDTGATTDIGAGVCADPDGEPGVGIGNAVVPQKLGLTG